MRADRPTSRPTPRRASSAPLPAGGVITALRARAQDPEAVAVVVGRRIAAVIERKHADHLHLALGAEWTEPLAARVAELGAERAARAEALRRLARRAFSRAGLIDALTRKGHDRKVAQHVVDQLASKGLIDDRAFADAAARDLLARKPAGRRRIESDLRAKRVPGDVAAEAARSAVEGRDPLADALSLIRRRAESGAKRLDPQTLARRLSSLLARRGYDSDTCRKAVATALKDAGAPLHDDPF